MGYKVTKQFTLTTKNLTVVLTHRMLQTSAIASEQ